MNKILKFKLLFLGCLVCLSIQSCGQNRAAKKEYNQKIEQMENKLTDKDYGYLYNLKYEHNNCSYEILINEVPLITFYGLGERSTGARINDYILKPGEQKITIRMLPKKINDTTFKKELDSTSYVKIKVKKALLGKKKPEWFKNSDWDEFFTYQTPKLEEDVPEVEFSTFFEAGTKEVTWELEGWRIGQQLSDTPALREEIFAFYRNFQKMIENQDKYAYLNLITHSVYEDALANSWRSKDFFKRAMEQIDEPIPKVKFMFPINEETAKLKFYADGKVVTLVSTDPRSYGYSPLIAKPEKGNFPISYTFYLYKPKDSNQLQIIR